MKKIVSLAIIIVFLSVVYYFAVYLPRMRDFEMTDKCAKKAKEYFIEHYSVAVSGMFCNYNCHYNKKLNKCFVEIRSVTNDPYYVANYFALYDAYEGMQYAEYGKVVNLNGTEKRKWEDIPPQDCSVAGKPCKSKQEYEYLTHPYKTE